MQALDALPREESMTPLSIIVASIVILAADYLVERYFHYKRFPFLLGFFWDQSNSWVKNPLRRPLPATGLNRGKAPVTK